MVIQAFKMKKDMSMLVEKSQVHKKAKDRKMMKRLCLTDDLKKFKIISLSSMWEQVPRALHKIHKTKIKIQDYKQD
ncbi:hypothetical protein Tco_0435034 [Tanacetum coccineum]